MKRLIENKHAFALGFALLAIASANVSPVQAKDQIIHDAEYYILEAQNGKVWAVEDGNLDKKIAELRTKYGRPPNLIHYMWDDQPLMSFGDPYLSEGPRLRDATPQQAGGGRHDVHPHADRTGLHAQSSGKPDRTACYPYGHLGDRFSNRIHRTRGRKRYHG